MYKRFLIITVVLLAYSFLTVVFTFPLIKHVSDGIITDNPADGDASQFIWNVYTFKKNVHEQTNPFFSDNIYYPIKANLLMHTYAPAMGIFGLMFENNFLAINVFLFLSFILSAFGTYLLARKYIENHVLSFLCGFMFAFSSYKLMHLFGHYHLLLTATIPFFILSFFKAVEYKQNRLFPAITSFYHVAVCALLFVVTFLCDYYASFYILYFIGFYSLYNRFLLNAVVDFKSVKTWGIIIATLVVSHILIRLLRLSGADDKGAFWWQADLMAYITPHTNSALYGQAYPENLMSVFHITNFMEGIVFPGYLFYVCLIFFVWDLSRGNISKSIKPLLFLAIIFFMITIPGFKVAGKQLLNLPTSILHFVPFINNIRCPPRIFAMVMLVSPIVIFYSVEGILKGKKHLRIAVSVLLLIGFILEYRPIPYQIFSVQDVPQAINYLKTIPSANVVMPIPTGLKDGLQETGKFMTKNLFFQTVHQKKMIGGYTSRMTKGVPEFYFADPVMKDLLTMRTDSAFYFDGSEAKANAFLSTFKPDVFLIYPSHRKSFHENYILSLLKGRKYTTKEMEGFLIIELKK